MSLPAPWLRELIDYNIPRLHSTTGLPQSITAKSIGEFLYACAWGVLLLIAFAGWGRLTAKLSRIQQLPASVACVLGIGGTIFIGGLLNLAHFIYADVLFVFIGVGALLYLVLRRHRPVDYGWKAFWKRTPTFSRALLVGALLIFFLRAAGTVRMAQFYIPDDSAAYLVFPQKMLAAHTFAADPFSDRRVTSDLGAPYFLESLVISATSLPHIAMADRALGLILLAGMLFEFAIAFQLSPFEIAFLEFLACIVPQETFNLTFVILPISLLLGMVWTLWKVSAESPQDIFRYSILAGVIGGAAIALKSTYLPMVCALLVIPYLLLFGRRNLARTIQLVLVAGLAAGVTIAAWMISMKLRSDTYLFPLLGQGLDYSRLALFPVTAKFFTTRSVSKTFLQGIALLGLALVQIYGDRTQKQSRLSLGVLLAGVLAITAMNYKTGADSVWRYNFPQFFTAVIVFYAASASVILRTPNSTRSRFAFYVGVASLVAMAFYYDLSGSRPRLFRQMGAELTNYRASMRVGLSGESLSSPYLQARYMQIENRIPKRAVALENVAYPFLFNYSSHKILVADWPGVAAPLPGWPFGKNSAELAKYLRNNSVRYVIYDTSYALHADAMACQVLHDTSHYSKWLTEQVWLNTLADHQFSELFAHYHSTYNDGQIVIIDLTGPISSSPVNDALWPVDADVTAVCSEIAQRYMSTQARSAHDISKIE